MYLRNEVLALIAHLDFVSLWVWEIDWLLSDELVHFEVVIAAGVERRETYNHLVGENTESPPVDGETMSLLIQNLWR